MTNEIERQVLDLVATDRIYTPSSSFDGKLKRSRKNIALQMSLEGDSFLGERTYARVENVDKQKARGMREGISKFSESYPKYGKILEGMIQEERTVRENHLFFGMNDGRRLTKEDYLGVLGEMGLTSSISEKYLDAALDISRNLSKKRDYAERSILIG